MECPEFEVVLNQRLDERIDPRCPELQAHAAGCPGCQLQLDDAMLVLRGISAWRVGLPATPSDLAGRIFAATHGELVSQVQVTASSTRVEVLPDRTRERGETRHSWHSWAVLAGTVAAVWLVFAGSLHETPNRGDHAPTAVAVRPKPVTKSPVDLGTVLVSAEGAYSQVANDSLSVAQDFALLWPTASSNPDSAPTGTTLPGSDWKPDFTRELAPIGNSVEDAWEFLRRTVPRVDKSAS